MSNDINSDEISNESNSGFLGDLTDGREKGSWKTRYDIEAHKEIIWERNYLIIVLISSLVIPLLIGVASNDCFWGITCGFTNLKKYVFGLSGGLLGGTLFAIKWLVHSVAKDTWNIDRRLWRIFTPPLSGGLAMVITILVNCQIFNLTEPENMTIHKCYGVGFLVGYFSDNAIGKLTEIAQVLFGSTISKRK